MENESSNGKPDDEPSVESDLDVKGDVIGETAYSQRFVLNALIKLNSQEELTEEFIEKDLCVLWDMTAEIDVARFLLRNGASDIFSSAIKNCENKRVVEIVIGTVANVYCHGDIFEGVRENDALIDDVLFFASSDDSMIVVQVLRFVFSLIFNEKDNVNARLERLEENDFSENLAFMLEYSTNESVLMNAFETLNCICSAATKRNGIESFKRLFCIKKIVDGTITAFGELSDLLDDEEKIKRWHLMFLAIHSMILNSLVDVFEVYRDNDENLISLVGDIILKNCRKVDDDTTEYLEYLVGICSCLNFPSDDVCVRILECVVNIWEHSEVDGTPNENKSESESPDDTVDYKNIVTVCVRYFARVLKLWPWTKLSNSFRSLKKKHLKRLQSTVTEMIKCEELDIYYSDVEDVIEKLCEDCT